ncbi:tricorn protease [Lewinella aquimaris]|uniref:Tricorn protease homolog n=1 Tax=Neolewinella aquimaris TaxID=1835722 RepID=A0A840E8J9_9BACT|nr:S41 family peptidase [Neolewinella aquimaris]MBB4080032.1 tricorn protease [Neolewinella aquimaris]
MYRILLPLLLFAFPSLHAQTRLVADPAISADHVAFAYAGDLWVADRDGSNVRRLTIGEGRESHPVFSPDGQTIAFTGAYDGNLDVYTVPTTGGIPKRLTWHPYPDEVQAFTPDGKGVLFTSKRDVFTNRYNQLFTIGLEGGEVTPLHLPTAFQADYSADGNYLAYTPLGDRSSMWKNYRGGTVSRVWVYQMADSSVVEIPKPETGSNDNFPQWLDGKVYFRSDRDGEYNLYSYDPATRATDRLTAFTDFPVIALNAGAGSIVFEQAGYLHTYDPGTREVNRVEIDFAADVLDVRPRYVTGGHHVRSAGVSPTGKRLVFDFRGEILTAPAEQGDVDNLTRSPGAHETYPAWSPDGKTIAFFSDASGEYALHLRAAAQETTREIALNGTGFYAHLHWSPDANHLAFVDNGRNLYVLNVASGQVKKVDQDVFYYPGEYRDLFGSWSHDGKWLAYSKITSTNFERAYVYNLATGESTPVTDPLVNVTEPVFDPSGKYLYLTASTDAGPVVNWFQQSSNDMRATNGIYLITLQKDVVSPIFHRNDREGEDDDAQFEAALEKERSADKPKKQAQETEARDTVVAPLVIDFDGLETRIVHLPLPNGNYDNLAAPAEGVLMFLSHSDEGSLINSYSLEEREATELIPADWFEVTADGKKLFVGSYGRWGVTSREEPTLEDLKSPDDYSLSVKIDPAAEWKNIFHEMWRVNRDYFYDPNMHGVDWTAMKQKYEPFLAAVRTSDDLYRVMEWMGSELGVGHHRFGSQGEPLREVEEVKGGLLGADYTTANGRYRFAKIYGGLNWNRDLASPLTEPGVNVKVGEYLLAVDGEELVAGDNLYRLFERTAGRIVELTVGPNADGTNSRKVMVTPVEDEYDLRNRDWVEGNLKKVNEATDGKVAYVYVPNTGGGGFEYFKRYFFPQVDKQAIIVDERFNGGGQIADYYIELLMRPYQNSWTYRYGQDQHAPVASIRGPKVLLVDETAGSGGDLFPYLWRQNELGPMIGKRTWGGLVGVLGFPEFIDGGSVTAPNVAFWDKDGYRVENEGVAPDIEVEQFPKDVMAGRDPQLERAIEEVMKQLREHPTPQPERPAFEKRGSAKF